MIDDYDYIIPTEPEVATPRYPVVRQLLILVAFLGFIFLVGFSPKIIALFKHDTPNTAATAVSLETEQSAIQNIGELSDVNIIAPYAYVYDVRTQRALYSKEADTVVPIASITKLMTALLAHELVTDEQTIIIPQAAALQESRSGLIPGERFTKDSLAHFALISSSNDAAYSIATAVGALLNEQNPNSSFVAAMNIKAEELGLTSMEFYNATGLDESTTQPGALSSARDVTFLMEYLLAQHPNILEPTTIAATRVYNQSGDYYEAENTNPTLLRIPNLLGSKTGYTDLAGGNLTIAFDAGFNRPIIITVLGSTFQGRFADVQQLVAATKAAIAANE